MGLGLGLGFRVGVRVRVQSPTSPVAVKKREGDIPELSGSTSRLTASYLVRPE